MRCELYRLLAEPVRARMLALAEREELSVGELAELLREGQPKVSRHASALREAGLIDARRQGTFTLLRLAPRALADAVVADAVRAGEAVCEADGTLARLDEVLAARDAETREFFARGGRPAPAGPPSELGAYLALVAPLLARRGLAIDAGTGDGALLEVLSPVFERVIALDRSQAQLALAARRIERRGLANTQLVCGELDGPELQAALHASTHQPTGADAVFAARVLHHAAVPARTLATLTSLARSPSATEPGGFVCVLDYAAHDDESLRAQEADLWLGFAEGDLATMARDAGLCDVRVSALPLAWQGEGPDRHLAWRTLVGRRASPAALPASRRASSRPG